MERDNIAAPQMVPDHAAIGNKPPTSKGCCAIKPGFRNKNTCKTTDKTSKGRTNLKHLLQAEHAGAATDSAVQPRASYFLELLGLSIERRGAAALHGSFGHCTTPKRTRSPSHFTPQYSAQQDAQPLLLSMGNRRLRSWTHRLHVEQHHILHTRDVDSCTLRTFISCYRTPRTLELMFKPQQA